MSTYLFPTSFIWLCCFYQGFKSFCFLKWLRYFLISIIRNRRPADCSINIWLVGPETENREVSCWAQIEKWLQVVTVRCSQSRCLRMRPSPRLSNDSFSPRAVSDTAITNRQIIDLPTDQNNKTTLANDSEKCHHNGRVVMQIILMKDLTFFSELFSVHYSLKLLQFDRITPANYFLVSLSCSYLKLHCPIQEMSIFSTRKITGYVFTKQIGSPLGNLLDRSGSV